MTYDFLMAPGSEAPSEMLWFIEEKKLIETAEDVTHTLHNTYSLRGAKIRQPLPWSKYINEALNLWGDKAEIILAQHHWPTWGNDNVVKLLKSQRDLYRYINDQTLRMANQGMTRDEIAANFKLPSSLANTWANRGYYGSVSHDVKATYVLYLGWFDGNPRRLMNCRQKKAQKNSSSIWAVLMPFYRKPNKIMTRVISAGLPRLLVRWCLPIQTTRQREIWKLMRLSS